MGKTYEALQWAEREYQAKRQEDLAESVPKRRTPPQVSSRSGVDRYQDLKTNILHRYPAGSIKTVMIVGTTHGSGASTTAINFATTLAKDPGLKVLLVDANLRTPSLHDVFKIDQAHGFSDLVDASGRMISPIQKTGPGSLWVLPCGGKFSDPIALFESSRLDQFLKLARERYDFVILDAPPVHRAAECAVLCSKVDGVVLVIESRKTRRPIALKAKEKLEKAGGKIIGVVLNRKKYYIPNFIYKRL